MQTCNNFSSNVCSRSRHGNFVGARLGCKLSATACRIHGEGKGIKSGTVVVLADEGREDEVEEETADFVDEDLLVAAVTDVDEEVNDEGIIVDGAVVEVLVVAAGWEIRVVAAG